MAPDMVRGALPPVVYGDTGILILGSFPGNRSLAEARYYAHPQNQFWRLVAEVTGSRLPQSYEDRLGLLARRRIGLWDVVASANRAGSLDAAIRDARFNDLEALVETLPALRAVGFNGKTATRWGRRLLSPRPAIALIDLPSSSPAYTLAFAEKAHMWSALKPFLD